MFFVAILCCILIFIKIKYKSFHNPYKLYMVFGKKGSGKSSYLVKIASNYRRKGWIVYCNMPDLDISGIRYINPSELGRFVPEPHSVVLLDEVGMLYDNRNYKDFKPEVRDFFKLQRHYQCIVYLASQSFDIDKKLRDLTDEMYLVTCISGIISLIRPITKKITLTEASSMGESKIADNLKFRWIFSWQFNFIPKYSKYFKSYLLPDHEFIKYTVNNNPARDTKHARVQFPNLKNLLSRHKASEESRENLGE